MSPLATQLLLWTMLAVDIAHLLACPAVCGARSILPTSPRLRAVARELAGPLACALLIVPISLIADSLLGVPEPIDGVVLTQVTPWLPVGEAGLAAGDRLVR